MKSDFVRKRIKSESAELDLDSRSNISVSVAKLVTQFELYSNGTVGLKIGRRLVVKATNK